MSKVLVVLALTWFLTACASGPFGTATTGGANYSYSKNQEGCQVTINSARDVAGGNIKIDKDCSVEVSAENAGSSARIIESLIDKIK